MPNHHDQSNAPICDGCQAQPPVELFDVRPFTRTVLGTLASVTYRDGWAFCPTCAALVRSRSWFALTERVMSLADMADVPARVARAELLDVFTYLDRNLTGRTKPFAQAH